MPPADKKKTVYIARAPVLVGDRATPSGWMFKVGQTAKDDYLEEIGKGAFEFEEVEAVPKAGNDLLKIVKDKMAWYTVRGDYSEVLPDEWPDVMQKWRTALATWRNIEDAKDSVAMAIEKHGMPPPGKKTKATADADTVGLAKKLAQAELKKREVEAEVDLYASKLKRAIVLNGVPKMEVQNESGTVAELSFSREVRTYFDSAKAKQFLTEEQIEECTEERESDVFRKKFNEGLM